MLEVASALIVVPAPGGVRAVPVGTGSFARFIWAIAGRQPEGRLAQLLSDARGGSTCPFRSMLRALHAAEDRAVTTGTASRTGHGPDVSAARATFRTPDLGLLNLPPRLIGQPSEQARALVGQPCERARVLIAGSPRAPIVDPSPPEAPREARSAVLVVRHRGREFLAKRAMAEIFRSQARRVIERNGSELVVLAHLDGVDLLFITASTPVRIESPTVEAPVAPRRPEAHPVTAQLAPPHVAGSRRIPAGHGRVSMPATQSSRPIPAMASDPPAFTRAPATARRSHERRRR